jgi:GR25 family glycosyltransferase involved in LPS biosynthesis
MKSYYINLKSRKDRLESFSSQFKKVRNLFVDDCDRIEAIKFSEYNVSYNKAACSASHAKAIRKAIQNGFARFTIFEDDVVFDESKTEDFITSYNSLPENFDLFYWGCVFQKSGSMYLPDKNKKSAENYSDTLYKLNSAGSAHAITYSLEFAKLLDENLFPKSYDRKSWIEWQKHFICYDHWLKFQGFNFNFFSPKFIYASQYNNYSDIDGKFSDRDSVIKNSISQI